MKSETATNWTYEERVKLKQLYGSMPVEDVALELGKTVKQVYNQVYYLRKRGWKFDKWKLK